MAQTFQFRRVQEGRKIAHTPGSAVGAGDPVTQGGLVGIAERAIAVNKLGAIATEGIFNGVKVNGALTAGDALYWDATGDPEGGTSGTGALTTTAANNTFVGYATKDAGATDEFVELVLLHTPGTPAGALANSITDPGDAGAIPVTQSGHVDLVTVAAETRTLADPTFKGQLILLSLKTDGGNCVVTAASPIDQAGRTVITLDDIGDSVALIGVTDGADIEWRVLLDDTVTRVSNITNPIADPGASGAIPVTQSGYCPLVSGGAETRTLAAPAFIGQELLLYMKTDGGDITLTCATIFNEAGNNTILFNDPGETVRMIAAEVDADIRWRAVVADGATLSTV